MRTVVWHSNSVYRCIGLLNCVIPYSFAGRCETRWPLYFFFFYICSKICKPQQISLPWKRTQKLSCMHPAINLSMLEKEIVAKWRCFRALKQWSLSIKNDTWWPTLAEKVPCIICWQPSVPRAAGIKRENKVDLQSCCFLYKAVLPTVLFVFSPLNTRSLAPFFSGDIDAQVFRCQQLHRDFPGCSLCTCHPAV